MATNFTPVAGKVKSPAKLAHVVLRTNNVRKLRAFYLDFLGAREAFGNETMSFLTYDDEHHRIAIFEFPDVADKVRFSCGLEHIAFTFDTLSDLLLAYRQRKALGMEPVWCINHGPTTSIYYSDTDGNILETQVDNMSPDEANAYITTGSFANNPLGVNFDPEELIKRLEQGESEASVMVRPDGPPASLPQIMLQA